MPWKYKDNKKDKENMLLMILTSKKKKPGCFLVANISSAV